MVSFEEDTPQRLIAGILPDLLVKGGDYKPEQIAGSEEVWANGGEVMVLNFEDGCSTTNIIKKIQKDNGFDFVGVKCHYDMSCHYCTECIAAAFMNDPYDWDGPKEPVVYACEADSDAALTMQILKLLTNDPVVFMDVRHWDEENQVLEFCNCGSESTWYAAKSDDPDENMNNVTLFPCLDIYAGGGCHVNCQTAPGLCTIARLCRSMDENGKRNYRMVMFTADLVSMPKEREKLTNEEWPHNFAKLHFDYHVFLDNFDANHAHAVYGDHIDELKTICKMMNIDVEVLGE